MSRDIVEWECEECKESPDRLNRVIGFPTKRFLCDNCSPNHGKVTE